MMVFVLGIAALILGYLFYSRVLQGIISPLRSTTPAYSHDDGVTASHPPCNRAPWPTYII